ncbi:ABC transporter substrate-binding protein [Actinokineospora auranticolor]|uniref:Polar amino acid transport system substrate-binding protein n=1 Tax=Actinokineospora auranticolor TaxID=155976 RepID=A0A2S6GRL9_9PSEU|nr:ABC transporter substrate-binding protein [Actinokineospora auranticolor]PPK67874.1 polar amino acid transport system substrate-binding protein [Actinokineospora auranticolor]
MRTSLLRVVALAVAGIAATTALTACGSSSGDAAAGSGGPQVLRVGTLGDAPPNVYQENGVYTGFDNELFKVVAEKAGYKVEFVGTDFSALLGQVANRTFDAGSSAIAQTDERRKTVDFSHPYNYEYVSVLSKDKSITDAQLLDGKRVAVIQATVGDKYLGATVPGAQIVRFPSYDAAIAGLRNGNVDAWVVDLTIAEKYAKDDPALAVTATIEAKDLPHGFAVRKGNDELRAKLNDGLRAAIADGTWLRLHDKFIPSVPAPSQFKP